MLHPCILDHHALTAVLFYYLYYITKPNTTNYLLWILHADPVQRPKLLIVAHEVLHWCQH